MSPGDALLTFVTLREQLRTFVDQLDEIRSGLGLLGV